MKYRTLNITENLKIKGKSETKILQKNIGSRK